MRAAQAANGALRRLQGALAPALAREPWRTLVRAACAALAFRALPGGTGLPLWAEAMAALIGIAAAEACLPKARAARRPPRPQGGPSGLEAPEDWDRPDPGFPSTGGDTSRSRGGPPPAHRFPPKHPNRKETPA